MKTWEEYLKQTNSDIQEWEEHHELREVVASLLYDNDRLNNIINKAIDYINRNTCANVEEQCNSIYLYDEYLNYLLNILRNEGEIQYLGYSDKECINCGRERVEKYSDGTEICEKCNFNQNKKEYVLRGEDNE